MITHLLSRRTFIVGCLITRAAAAFGFTSIAQKTVDKRNSSEIGEYAVGFASKASDGGFDHAFIVWYYSDPNGQRTVRRCAGFYPVSDSSTKSYDMILGVSGKVFDDSKVKISQEITVLVNKEAFDRAIAIENQYKNGQTYHLGFGDCTTFVQNVAASIPGLNIPSRVEHIYPSDFVSALYDAN